MGEAGHGEVTELLLAWSGGEASALDKVMPLVYAELHRLAHRYLSHERPGHTLQTSELINEAYLRLVDANRVNWQDRAHFLAVAAKAMRRVLVEHARARGSQRRGAGVPLLPLEAALKVQAQQSPDLVEHARARGVRGVAVASRFHLERTNDGKHAFPPPPGPGGRQGQGQNWRATAFPGRSAFAEFQLQWLCDSPRSQFQGWRGQDHNAGASGRVPASSRMAESAGVKR
jgi:hypothetical protein